MSAGQQSSDGCCCDGVPRWPGRMHKGHASCRRTDGPILAAMPLHADPGHVWGGVIGRDHARAPWGFLGVSAGIAHARTRRLRKWRRGFPRHRARTREAQPQDHRKVRPAAGVLSVPKGADGGGSKVWGVRTAIRAPSRLVAPPVEENTVAGGRSKVWSLCASDTVSCPKRAHPQLAGRGDRCRRHAAGSDAPGPALTDPQRCPSRTRPRVYGWPGHCCGGFPLPSPARAGEAVKQTGGKRRLRRAGLARCHPTPCP